MLLLICIWCFVSEVSYIPTSPYEPHSFIAFISWISQDYPGGAVVLYISKLYDRCCSQLRVIQFHILLELICQGIFLIIQKII
jgi:hypothetical protein